jgi:hypothetical protein
MIGSTRANIRSTFFGSPSLPALLAGNLNLARNFLSAFDEAALRPAVMVGGTARPCTELGIHRLLSPTQGDLQFLTQGDLQFLTQGDLQILNLIQYSLPYRTEEGDSCIFVTWTIFLLWPLLNYQCIFGLKVMY